MRRSIPVWMAVSLAVVAGATWAGLANKAAVFDGIVETTSGGYMFPDGTVQTTAAAVTQPRRVYLTDAAFPGNTALTACTEAGFHMASIWEVLEPASLEYAKELTGAETDLDLGEGLAAGRAGWIRTGAGISSGNPVAGQANCDAWTAGSGFGTTVLLGGNWTDISTGLFSPWRAATQDCSNSQRVWCVED